MNEKEEFRKFLDWFEFNKNNLPDWINEEMSIHKVRMLWKEKVNPDSWEEIADTENKIRG
jgi:hypothetical protein